MRGCVLCCLLHVGLVKGQLGWLFPAPPVSSEEDLAYLKHNADDPAVTVLPSGLQYSVLESGPSSGASPQYGMTRCTAYANFSYINGTGVTSSVPGKPITLAPLTLIPGGPGVPKGVSEALVLMRPGDKWALTVPAELVSGGALGARFFERRHGDIQLVQLELLEVDPPSMAAAFEVYLKPYLFLVLLLVQVGVQYCMMPGKKKKGKALSVTDAAAAQTGPPLAVFLDVTVGDQPAGRIELELFSTLFPKTADNFRALCTGEKGSGGVKGKPRHYKGTTFHRVIPGFMLQGGDTTAGDGTGGESIHGTAESPYFEDEFENGVVGHSEAYLLSMANAGEHTNGSQFFVTAAAAPHLDGKHVVFGRVARGQDVVRAIEAVGTRYGRTRQPVTIVDCGEIVPSAPPAAAPTASTST